MRLPLLVILLFPLVATSKRDEEPRPVFWHSDNVYLHILNFFWARPIHRYIKEAPLIFRDVRSALLEQEKWAVALIRDAGKPIDEVINVELILLDEDEKYRDWDPVWVRKTVFPEKSRIRVFLNEPSNSPISVHCNKTNYASIYFSMTIAMGDYFFRPQLICRFGTPSSDHGNLTYIISLVLGSVVFCLIILASMGQKSMNETHVKADDKAGNYLQTLEAYQQLFANKMGPDGKPVEDWPDDSLLPEEFRIAKVPDGPHDDPFAPAYRPPGYRGEFIVQEGAGEVFEC